LKISREEFSQFIKDTSNYKKYGILSITKKDIVHEVLQNLNRLELFFKV